MIYMYYIYTAYVHICVYVNISTYALYIYTAESILLALPCISCKMLICQQYKKTGHLPEVTLWPVSLVHTLSWTFFSGICSILLHSDSTSNLISPKPNYYIL